jgi:phasin family protein
MSTNFDVGKIFASFKMPNVDMASTVETGQKNFAAMTAMNSAAFGSITAIAQRQGDMMRTAMEDFANHTRDLFTAGNLEEKVAKQIDFTKKTYDAAIAHTKELGELYTQSQAETLAAIQDRVTALSEEVKTAIAKKERPSA